MMNIGDKALMNEIKCNTIQRRSKAKMSFETFQENSYVRVSNYIRILDGGYIRFHQPIGIQIRIAQKMGCSRESHLQQNKLLQNRDNWESRRTERIRCWIYLEKWEISIKN